MVANCLVDLELAMRDGTDLHTRLALLRWYAGNMLAALQIFPR
jgi:hypothetical protein